MEEGTSETGGSRGEVEGVCRAVSLYGAAWTMTC